MSLLLRLSGRHFVVKDKYDLIASQTLPEENHLKYGGGLNKRAYEILGINAEENPFFLEYLINPKSLLWPFQVHYWYYHPRSGISAMTADDAQIIFEADWRVIAKEDVQTFFLRSSALKFIAQTIREFDEFTSRHLPDRLAIETIKLK